jgi:uncharacterized protein (TIGR02145 family)
MDSRKKNVFNKLNMPHALCGLLCFFALLFCGCTEVPENCGNYVLRDPVTKGCLPSTDPNRPFFTVTVEAGDGATGGGRYSEREIVAISAGKAEDGKKFKNWTTSNGGVKFDDANNATTKFKMPAGDVTVTAVFERTSGPVTPPDSIISPPDSTVPPPPNNVKYAVVVSSEGKDATAGDNYAAGDTVWISAGMAPNGKQFKNWTTTSDGVTFTSANSPTTTFIMPANDVTVTAAFETQTVAPTMYAVMVVSKGIGAKGTDNYAAGTTVTISAGTAPSGQQFKDWTTSSVGVNFVNENSSTTTFVMPDNVVTVTANFEDKPMMPKYKVTVSSVGTSSSGGGDYEAGETVRIYAGTAPDGKPFKTWTTLSSGVIFANANNSSTTFIMPANWVTVTAEFETSVTSAPTCTVMVRGGTGGGNYVKGVTVSITATVPSGQQFKNWTTTSSGVTFANANSSTTTFVMPGNAVTVVANFNAVSTPPSTGSTLEDNRDGQTYGTVVIGGKTWMAKNLNYETPSGSWCYENKYANCDTYGRLYTWEAAKNACPSGWHLPDTADWSKLVATAGGQATAGKKLKSKNGWNNNGNGTDDFGFSALPGGIRFSDGDFNAAGRHGNWWTATEYGDYAYTRHMNYVNDNVSADYDDKYGGGAVRCVQN